MSWKNLRYRGVWCVVLLLWTLSLQAQDDTLYQRKLFVDGRDTMRYRILLPADYKPSKRYPILFFLHGSGERGSDNQAQLVHGSRLFLADSNRYRYPAIVVFPQCSEDSYWSNVAISKDSLGQYTGLQFPLKAPPTKAMSVLMKLVKQLIRQYPVKSDQVYVGGLSMGGMGTFEIVQRMPQLFAAAMPICGGQNPSRVQRKAPRLAWWIFHGAVDPVVPEELSSSMAAALKSAGHDVRYTVYPNVGHDSWTPAFAEPDLLPWLFSKRRTKQHSK